MRIFKFTFTIIFLFITFNFLIADLNEFELREEIIGSWEFSEPHGAITLELTKNNQWREKIVQFSFQGDYKDNIVSDLTGKYKVTKKGDNFYLTLIKNNGKVYKKGYLNLQKYTKLKFGDIVFERSNISEKYKSIKKHFFKFFNRFKSDKDFQFRRIEFPLSGNTYGESAAVITRNKWKMEDFEPDNENEIWGKPDVHLKKAFISYSIKDTGIYLEYVFALRDGKWFLIKLNNYST